MHSYGLPVFLVVAFSLFYAHVQSGNDKKVGVKYVLGRELELSSGVNRSKTRRYSSVRLLS